MVRQKEFNKHMDDYLRKVTKRPILKLRSPIFLKKKPKPVPIEALEKVELEKADMEIGKKSVLANIFDRLFGSRAKVVSPEDFDKLPEFEPKPEPKEDEIEEIDDDFEEHEIERTSFIDTLKRVLWGEKKQDVIYEEDEPEIKKVVLMKPEVEQELKFVLKLLDVVMERLDAKNKDFVLRSREYKLYKKIKKNHLK